MTESTRPFPCKHACFFKKHTCFIETKSQYIKIACEMRVLPVICTCYYVIPKKYCLLFYANTSISYDCCQTSRCNS